MKLIIQIPCLNEAQTLPATLADLPHEILGIDRVEWLVIDDGSTDQTVEVARACGVDHIVQLGGHKGLATAFQTGLNASLQLGADIIVNTDGDHQYPGRFIPALIAPILSGEADMVIADRNSGSNPQFSLMKRLLQRAGSATVRYVSGTTVPDAPSGFRAFSREAALRINVLTGYTYTLETIIQAGKNRLTIAHLPIVTNPPLRESHLIGSTLQYVGRGAVTIIKLFALYEPFRTFAYASLPFFAAGLGLWIRFAILLGLGEAGRGTNVQSVIVGSALLVIGVLIFLMGLLADVVATGRKIQEETLYYLKRTVLRPASRVEPGPGGEQVRSGSTLR